MWAILVFILLLTYMYSKITTTHSYWSKKGIKGPKPDLIFGNLKPVTWLQQYSLVTLAAKMYNDFVDEKVVGIYQGLTPTLVLRDPGIIKTVIVKDYASFSSRGFTVSTKPSLANIFTADGDLWWLLRKNLAPVFGTGKVKDMFPLIKACVENYMEYLDKTIVGVSPKDVQELNIKYTVKTVAGAALGLAVDRYADKITELETFSKALTKSNAVRDIAYFINNVFPGKVSELLHTVPRNDVANFFIKLIRDQIQERDRKTEERLDLMDKLIEMKKQGKIKYGCAEYEMCDELIAAQLVLIFSAGFDTSTGALTFFLYELALQPSIQIRCQKEIDSVMEKYNDQLDFDALTKELPYVSMVMEETLRKYPIGAILSRQAVVDYTFKDIDLTIDKGTKLWVSVLALHNDPKYFPEPEKFDPERFSPENKKNMRGYYMPFGDGPKTCLGMHFARIQSLMVVTYFLHKFHVSPCEKTQKQMKLDPRHLTMGPEGGLWLNIEKRNKNGK